MKEDLFITDPERLTLIDILTSVATLLIAQKIWFNKKGLDYNQPYIDFCKTLVAKLEKMEVHYEQ
jgi:hypothetical protein